MSWYGDERGDRWPESDVREQQRHARLVPGAGDRQMQTLTAASPVVAMPLCSRCVALRRMRVCASTPSRASVGGTREASQPGRTRSRDGGDHEREDLDRTPARGEPRDREAGHVLEVAVDHDLTIDSGYRAGQARRR